MKKDGQDVFSLEKFIYMMVCIVDVENTGIANDLYTIFTEHNGGEFFRNQGKTLDQYVTKEKGEGFIPELIGGTGREYVESLAFTSKDKYKRLTKAQALDALLQCVMHRNSKGIIIVETKGKEDAKPSKGIH